jgi:shikimate dehydrogenase
VSAADRSPAAGDGAISGRTAVAGVIGDPVEHSLSPALHNAAFEALGLDWAYVAFPVAPGDVRAALAGAVALGIRGLSVTMPHKQAVAEAADERTVTVERLGAANTVLFRAGAAVAHSTDGAGLLADLVEGAQFDPARRRCVVLGAGGAASAVVLALAEAGAASVVVVNRTADRAARVAALAGGVGRVGSPDDLEDADLVVNATPVGMEGGDASPITSSDAIPAMSAPSTALDAAGTVTAPLGARLARGQLAVDLVYAPPVTPFLADAAAAGAATRNGLGMLVHQAALQFELWTGERAPVDVMWAAARGRRRPAGR